MEQITQSAMPNPERNSKRKAEELASASSKSKSCHHLDLGQLP